LAPDEVGEICVAPARRGSWVGIYTPMLGYWRCPEATERALRGDVYHTGDLGFLDDEGTLFIRGRRNELILRGGANVYPAEVERAIQEDPRVAAAAVLGIPDPRLGQRVVAAVQPEAGERLTAEQVASFCRERLARYKIPEQIAVVSSLPRNSMSKVIKRELEPLFRERAP
jgi:acyl-CoA synthetase (AMP-forming)/AMP-acid ligase II